MFTSLTVVLFVYTAVCLVDESLDVRRIAEEEVVRCAADVAAVGACLVFEGTAKGQPKDTHVWYFLVKGRAIYQLRMACEAEKYKEAKKDFDKIYRKWKF